MNIPPFNGSSTLLPVRAEQLSMSSKAYQLGLYCPTCNVSKILSEVHLSDRETLFQSKLLDSKQELPDSLLWYILRGQEKISMCPFCLKYCCLIFQKQKMRKEELEHEVKTSTPEGNYVMALKSILTSILLLPHHKL